MDVGVTFYQENIEPESWSCQLTEGRKKNIKELSLKDVPNLMCEFLNNFLSQKCDLLIDCPRWYCDNGRTNFHKIFFLWLKVSLFIQNTI